MRLAIQAILAVAVVALSYLLFRTLTDPQKEYERLLAIQAQSRERMSDVRTAMTAFERQEGRYLKSLDSLVLFVKSDSAYRATSWEAFEGETRVRPFSADSMIYSPRTGERFELAVQDTSDVNMYVLRDPASADSIGALEPIPTLRNAASWE